MSEKFIASNSVEISFTPDDDDGIHLIGEGEVIKGSVRRWIEATGSPEGVVALREFFLHEAGLWRDEETGRLVARIPDSDDEDGRAVHVVGRAGVYWEKHPLDIDESSESNLAIVARYFKDHPVREPWHDAKVGEVWLLTIDHKGVSQEHDGGVVCFLNKRGEFAATKGVMWIGMRDEQIIAARRLWPEEGE